MDTAVTALLFACRICGSPLHACTCGRCGADNHALLWQGQRIDYRRGDGPDASGSIGTANDPALAVRQACAWCEVEKVSDD